MGYPKHVFPLEFPEKKEILGRFLQGKDPVDSSFADKLSSDLSSWAKKLGVTHFCYKSCPDLFEIDDLQGSSLLKKVISKKSLVRFDPTSIAFVYQSILWIPSLVFATDHTLQDWKVPYLKSEKKLETVLNELFLFFGEDVDLQQSQTKIRQQFYLVEESLYQKCPDLALLGKRVYGTSHFSSNELFDPFFKKLESVMSGLGLDIEIRELKPSQYEIAFGLMPSSYAIDQNLFLMEQIKAIGKEHGLVPLFHEKPFPANASSEKEVVWRPFDFKKVEKAPCAVVCKAFTHALQTHENLLSFFCSYFGEGRATIFFDEENGLALRHLSPLSHVGFVLCSIQSALADSLSLFLSEMKRTDWMDVLKKHEAPVETSKKEFYGALSNKKTERCFSSVLDVQELEFLERSHMDLYGKQREKEADLMVQIFREEILPLVNKKEPDDNILPEQAIYAVNELELFCLVNNDLGIEAKAKAFFEIGTEKISRAKVAVNRLFIDF